MKIEDMTAHEFLLLVADALYATHTPKFEMCQDPGCNNQIKRGVRCESCAAAKRKQQDRAYEARRKRQKELEKAVRDDIHATSETGEGVG